MERTNSENEAKESFPIIGVIGPNGAGKDTVAHILQNHFGMEIFRTSDTLSRLALAQDANIPRSKEFLDDIHKKLEADDEPGALVKTMIELINTTRSLKKFDGAIISGIDSQTDVEIIKSLPNGYIVAIDASGDLRHNRILHREREEKSKTWEEFQTQDVIDKAKIYDLFPLADTIIDNSGDLDDLEQQLIQYAIEETQLF